MLADRRFTEMVSILGEKVGSRRAHGDTLPRGFVGDRSNTRAGSWVGQDAIQLWLSSCYPFCSVESVAKGRFVYLAFKLVDFT